MEIKIDNRVKKYLQQKNCDALTINTQGGNCCSGGTIPVINMGEPKDSDEYNINVIDGIKVYVEKNIRSKKNLITVTLSSFLVFKSIDVHGIDMY